MFFLLPVGVDYRASRYPVATFSLMGACVLVYLINIAGGVLGGIEGFDAVFDGLALIPGGGHLHGWVTSLFVHAGFFHLLGNMVYLFLFGSCVEDIFGRPKYVAYFLVAGVLSNFTEVLVLPDHFNSTIRVVGASGAISACMGAFAVLLRRTEVEFRFLYFFVFTMGSWEFRLPSWLILSLWFLDDLLGMFATIGESGGGVAFAAHVGGFSFGALVGAIVRSRGWKGDVDEAAVHPPVRVAPVPVRSQARPMRVIPLTPSAPAAPVADVPEPTLILWINGGQAGPFPLSGVREMRAIGSLADTDLFWDEAANTWRAISDLP